MKRINDLDQYANYLFQRELSESTINIYIREANRLLDFLQDRQITKEEIISYKKAILEMHQKTSTTNLRIVAVNSYLTYAGYNNYKIRTERIQKHRCLENIINMEEYKRILDYAKDSNRPKYYFIIRVLVYTGIRISELNYLTVEVLPEGKFTVGNKGKIRDVYIPSNLAKELSGYCHSQSICSGVIFRGNCQKPISRIAVYKMLIHLADMAGVEKKKAHPHSFRHLFAITYMKKYANLTELADILGHASLETTRIYTMTTAEEKRIRLEQLGF